MTEFRRPPTWAALLAAVTLNAGCTSDSTSDPPPPAAVAPAEGATTVPFVDVSAAAGIDQAPICGDENKDFILEVNGTGACWLDYDQDGHLDLYVVDGSTMANWSNGLPGEPNRLYRGRGDGRFERVDAAAGADDRGWGYGCAVADVDNDGWPDLVVTNYGGHELFGNLGGRFERRTKAAGLGSRELGGPHPWSTGATFADFDGDGLLDLFVVNYLDFDVDDPPVDGKVLAGTVLSCRWGGKVVMCGPLGLVPQGDRLYRNLGDGRFEDVTVAAGIDRARPGYGFSAAAIDYDDDGDIDLYVVNDSVANHLWTNDGRGHFEELALQTGSAVDESGAAQASMGLDVGDIDGDGRVDLVFSNFAKEYYSVLRNLGDGMFMDVSYVSGVGAATMERLGWGLGLVDLDNDGDLDLFAVNGHVYPGLGTGEGAFRQRNQLFTNDGGQFRDVSDWSGPALQARRVGRGVAFADFDEDGGVDLIATNLDEPPTVLRNSGDRGHWLSLQLVGTRSNRDGIGTRATVSASGRSQTRTYRAGGSYLSGNAPRLHLGVGKATRVSVELRWPSGTVTRLDDLAVDQSITVREDGVREDGVREDGAREDGVLPSTGPAAAEATTP